jgi:hypothetical protein
VHLHDVTEPVTIAATLPWSDGSAGRQVSFWFYSLAVIETYS